MISLYLQKFHTKETLCLPGNVNMPAFSLQDDFNMTLPEWTSEIYPEPLYSLASQVYEYHNLDPAVRKINSGYLLAKILKDTISKVQNILQPSDRKIFLYSGHETTLGYMMEALQVFKAHIPPYASALIFEVHKNNDGHFLKVSVLCN